MSTTVSLDFSPIPAPLLALAPGRLANYRKMRYVGDDLCVRLERLDPGDQAVLRRLYEGLCELLTVIADTATNDAQKWQAAGHWAKQHHLDSLIDEVRTMGLTSQARDPGEELSKAMHDVRGGALSALLGRLQLLDLLPCTEENLKAIFVLARDHLKIIRNAIVGIDEPRRNADRTPKSHAMKLMLDKWHESVVGPQWEERSVQMFIDCRYEGAVTECCLESAAIDRIFYNLAANACRHTTGERLEMVVFPMPAPPGECLRFVLSNEVSGADAARLRALDGSGENLLALFEPEVSSTGSGYGLTVVADFVAGAFGLSDRTAALHGRYVGAVLDGNTFRVWFHWPIAHDDLPQKLDDYHRPQQSLSG